MQKISLLTLLSLSLVCASCDNSSQRQEKDKKPNTVSLSAENTSLLSEKEKSEIRDLSKEQQNFYLQLNSSMRPVFLQLNAKDKDHAIAMTHVLDPKDSLIHAAHHDAHTRTQEQKALFHRIDIKEQTLFLVLSQEAINFAVERAKSINANKAIVEASQMDLNKLTQEQKEFYNDLDSTLQPLFLLFSAGLRAYAIEESEKVGPKEAMNEAAKWYVEDLPPEEQAFYTKLDPDLQPLFLIITPKSRIMAVTMSEVMDPNLAVKYAIPSK